MIKHVILWQLKDELNNEEKQKVAQNIKESLEALVGKVPGLTEVTVNIHPLSTSNADVMLDSTVESEEALKNYQTHPDHVAAADTYVRPYIKNRVCMDYEI